MILSRLRVREKLGLILLLPVTAVIVLAIPFVADRVDDARAAAEAADAARTARPVGALIQELQQERLVSLVYLTARQADRGALVAQTQTVTDVTADLRNTLGTDLTPGLARVLTELDELDEIRRGVLDRTIPPRRVLQQFGLRIERLIGELRLAPQLYTGTTSGRQIAVLDALLRANEANSVSGAALVIGTVDRELGVLLYTVGITSERLHIGRLRQLGTQQQDSLLQSVLNESRAGERVFALAEQLQGAPNRPRTALDVTETLNAVEAEAGLRRMVQDSIAREVAARAAGSARGAAVAAATIGVSVLMLFFIVVGLGARVSGSIARPMTRLTRAATMVAELARSELIRVSDEERVEERAPRLAAIDVASQDEVGELASAFNQVQATAALLLERQVVSRRNVASMFANVGRRTQNLVNRQLALIDDLERNEQNPQLLAQLYQLDHISTRLRRSAYSLLVVSGSQEQSLAAKAAPLANVVRSALGEIEGFRQVRLGRICDVHIVADLVSDLALLLAELLENATSFSPPQTPVDTHAELFGTFCRVSVVDHGIGMPPDQMAEENRRLVERERLDVAPTSVLGLFVVGRLARRHGLDVRLVPTAGRGVTAQVDIPNSMFTHSAVPAAPPRTITVAPEPVPPRALTPAPRALPASAGGANTFTWFPEARSQRPADDRPQRPAERPVTAMTSPVAAARPPGPPGQRRAGLIRRVPGAQLMEPERGRTAARERPDGAEPRRERSPEAARATVEAFEAGAVRAAREHLAPVPNPPHTEPPAHRMPLPHRPPPMRPAPPAHAAPPPMRPVPPMRPAPAADPSAGMATRNGLTRRVPGAHLADALHERPGRPMAPTSPSRQSRDHFEQSSRKPESERDTLNAFLEGFAEGRARHGSDAD